MANINYTKQFQEAFPALNIRNVLTEAEFKVYFSEKYKDKKVFIIFTDGLVENFSFDFDRRRRDSDQPMRLHDKLSALVIACVRFYLFNAAKKGHLTLSNEALARMTQEFENDFDYSLLQAGFGRDDSTSLTSVLKNFELYQSIVKSPLGQDFAERVELVFTPLSSNPTLTKIRYSFKDKALTSDNVVIYTGSKEIAYPTVFSDLRDFSGWTIAIQQWLEGQWLGGSILQ